MKIERKYKGRCLLQSGLAFNGIINWDTIFNIYEQIPVEKFIETNGNLLSLYVDETMEKIYCKYIYDEEYGVYLSEEEEKREQFLKILDIDRIDFFSISKLRELVGDKTFYSTLEVELEKGNVKIIKDLEGRIGDFPNTLEEYGEIFEDGILEKFFEKDKKVKFTMSICLEKNGNKIISNSIEI